MNEESFLIDCPMCKARIEVESKTGKVLRHWEKPVVKEGGDQMKDALKKIKQDQSRLEDYFSKAQGDMEKKKKELLDTFEKEAKRIKDSGDTSKPINPLDLD